MTRSRIEGDSPFLRIPVGWRVAIVLYYFFYQFLFPVIAALGSSDAEALLLPRVIVRFLHVALICWPLLFYRREFGFLHPLVLPTLFTTLKELAKTPLALIAPLDLPLVSFDISSSSIAQSIKELSPDELAWMRLWHGATLVAGLACYYVGYFVLKSFKVPNTAFHAPRHLAQVCFAATIACTLSGIYFIQVYGGGLVEHLIAMSTGRAALFEGLGQFLFIAEFAVLPVLVWFVYARRLLLNPFWVLALVAASLIGMLTSGSRSAFVYPLIVLVLLWWRKAGRVLIGPTLALGFVAVAAIGIFGSIRQDYSSGVSAVSELSGDSLGEVIERAQTEFEERNAEEASFAAFVGAQEMLLWGRTYVASLAFFVPRALWPGKPRSADAYNMWINFSGEGLESFGTDMVWGIPVGAVEEAFWNFHLPGVVIVFLLIGSFHRWLSGWVWRHPHSPAALLLSVWISINFTGTSISLTGTVRDVILLAGLFYALRIWRWRSLRRRPANVFA
jgi:hypothetical protein